jgi:hypothetical protein
MKNSKTVINQKTSNDFIVNIQVDGLSYRNLLVLEDIFNTFIEIRESEVIHLTNEQKEEGTHSYLIHPSVELRDSIRQAILEIIPNVKFARPEVKSDRLQCLGSHFHQK